MKKSTTSHKLKKTSELKRALLTLFILSLLGWLILISCALYIWVTRDFASAFQWIRHLSDFPDLPPHAATVAHEPARQIVNDVQFHASLLLLLLRASTYVMLMKFVTLLAAIPLFFLSTLAGLVDGLNQRAIRAACLGRESTYVFHKSVPLARKIMCLVLGGWLCVPVTLPSSPIFVGLAVMLALVMRMSVSRFKKYL